MFLKEYLLLNELNKISFKMFCDNCWLADIFGKNIQKYKKLLV